MNNILKFSLIAALICNVQAAFGMAAANAGERPQQHIKGALLGVYAGNALGRPVEDMGINEINAAFPGGLRSFANLRLQDKRILGQQVDHVPYTSDICMFNIVRDCLNQGVREDLDNNQIARNVAQQFVDTRNDDHGWAHAYRVPGNATVDAVNRIVGADREQDEWYLQGEERQGGCGSLVRAIPCGLMEVGLDRKTELAAELCRITHGNQGAIAASAAIAAGISRATTPCGTGIVLQHMIVAARRYDGRPYSDNAFECGTAAMIEHALDDVRGRRRDPEDVLRALGGRGANQAVAMAAVIFHVVSEDPARAVQLGVNIPGFSATVGALAGALVGARQGLDHLPAWFHQVEGAEELLRDHEVQPAQAAAEAGPPARGVVRGVPAPAPVHAAGEAGPPAGVRQAAEPVVHLDQAQLEDRCMASMISGGAGDALGRVTEFENSLVDIHAKYGGAGVRTFADFKADDYVSGIRHFDYAPYTDDTAMTIHVMQVLGQAAQNGWNLDGTMPEMAQAFINGMLDEDNGWAVAYRAPGGACIAGVQAAQRADRARQNWWHTGGAGAGGCGSVMRAHPFGLYFWNNPERAIEWAVEHSRITHQAPIALAACAAMATGVAHAVQGAPVDIILERMVAAAGQYDDRPYNMNHLQCGTAAMIERAIQYARDGKPSDEVFDEFRGWAAHEAIAATAYILAISPDNVERAVQLGVNTPGDSDSIASMAGALVGARVGMRDVPQEWLNTVEGVHELLIPAGLRAARANLAPVRHADEEALRGPAAGMQQVQELHEREMEAGRQQIEADAQQVQDGIARFRFLPDFYVAAAREQREARERAEQEAVERRQRAAAERLRERLEAERVAERVAAERRQREEEVLEQRAAAARRQAAEQAAAEVREQLEEGRRLRALGREVDRVAGFAGAQAAAPARIVPPLRQPGQGRAGNPPGGEEFERAAGAVPLRRDRRRLPNHPAAEQVAEAAVVPEHDEAPLPDRAEPVGEYNFWRDMYNGIKGNLVRLGQSIRGAMPRRIGLPGRPGGKTLFSTAVGSFFAVISIKPAVRLFTRMCPKLSPRSRMGCAVATSAAIGFPAFGITHWLTGRVERHVMNSIIDASEEIDRRG